MFFVYILFSEKLRKYYTGSTMDVNLRLSGHNSGKTPYTRKGIPWVLKYTEIFSEKTEVFKREKYIKSIKSRFFIENLLKTAIMLFPYTTLFRSRSGES